MTLLEWADAGLLTDTGDLSRLVDQGRLPPPPVVELHGDMLRYRSHDPRAGEDEPVPVTVSNRLLPEFLGLATAPATQIRDFAARWGVLGICAHGLPKSHRAMTDPVGWLGRRRPFCTATVVEDSARMRSVRELVELYGDDLEKQLTDPANWTSPPPPPRPYLWYQEPLGTWRGFSRTANALLNAAANLHRGLRARHEDLLALIDWLRLWNVYHPCPFAFDSETGEARDCCDLVANQRSYDADTVQGLVSGPQQGRWDDEDEGGADLALDEHRMAVASLLRKWTTIGGVRLDFGWIKGHPTLHLNGTDLFGALVVQLLFALGRVDGLAFCDNCGSPYFPKRRPRDDQRRYCRREDCLRARARDAQRDRQARKRSRRGSDSNPDS